jgi:hypothetical protein
MENGGTAQHILTSAPDGDAWSASFTSIYRLEKSSLYALNKSRRVGLEVAVKRKITGPGLNFYLFAYLFLFY